ncbi:MAG: two-component system OmpR family KDP operon response regulator [Beijerinckiaceae bacterium]|nr:MAG: two-component system OmpR family KDP operon response regulator [Beijerinckiaceae bacterium]
MIIRHTVLVIDDEPQIQRFLRHSLAASGYQLLHAETAAAGLKAVAAQHPDIIVLDLGLPDLDGKAVIGQIRQTAETPIIVLSARDQEAEKIAALDLGADDFVAKPFGIGELLARIRVCLRATRTMMASSQKLTLGDIVIDIEAHRVEREGALIKLTPKEFDLLALLARNTGKVLTHRHILQTIWGPAHVDDTPYLRVFIGQLRQKVEINSSEPKLILTEPGVGYRASSSSL